MGFYLDLLRISLWFYWESKTGPIKSRQHLIKFKVWHLSNWVIRTLEKTVRYYETSGITRRRHGITSHSIWIIAMESPVCYDNSFRSMPKSHSVTYPIYWKLGAIIATGKKHVLPNTQLSLPRSHYIYIYVKNKRNKKLQPGNWKSLNQCPPPTTISCVWSVWTERRHGLWGMCPWKRPTLELGSGFSQHPEVSMWPSKRIEGRYGEKPKVQIV